MRSVLFQIGQAIDARRSRAVKVGVTLNGVASNVHVAAAPDTLSLCGSAMSSSKPTSASFPPPETVVVETRRVMCDGGGGALGHPRVYYDISDEGFVECGYCDRRFVLKGGPADS